MVASWRIFPVSVVNEWHKFIERRGIRYKKSVEAINGIIDYLNFKGKTTLIDTLNFLSDNENNENDE